MALGTETPDGRDADGAVSALADFCSVPFVAGWGLVVGSAVAGVGDDAFATGFSASEPGFAVAGLLSGLLVAGLAFMGAAGGATAAIDSPASRAKGTAARDRTLTPSGASTSMRMM